MIPTIQTTPQETHWLEKAMPDRPDYGDDPRRDPEHTRRLERDPLICGTCGTVWRTVDPECSCESKNGTHKDDCKSITCNALRFDPEHPWEKGKKRKTIRCKGHAVVGE